MRTGNNAVDAESRAGLVGLTATLNRRTAVETAEPLGVDIESDELIFFPLLYWPVTAEQAPPSARAAERINRYLQTGGTILFDTRDAGDATPGPFGSAAASQAAAAPAGRRHQDPVAGAGGARPCADQIILSAARVPRPLDRRRSCGSSRSRTGSMTASRASSSAATTGPAPGRSTIRAGRLSPCVPGGEPQREIATRFGVNLVMYVLTGNYKTDQVHVPAILERLGQ